MTPDELTQAVLECRKRWNSWSSFLTRAWDFKTHLNSLYRLRNYLVYNRLYASEALTKQGMFFGHHKDGIVPTVLASDTEMRGPERQVH